MKLTLTFPLPAKGLRPNDRCHWAKKARLTRAARELGRREMFKASGTVEAELWRVVSYRRIYWFKTSRWLDADNCGGTSTKGILDGIADALGDDDKAWQDKGTTRGTDKSNPRLEIEFEIEELI